MEEFVESFGDLMRRLPLPVVVLTVDSGEEDRGMTAASFTPLSYQRPLVAINVKNRARTLALLSKAKGFVINLLAEDQSDLAERFSLPELVDREQFCGVNVVRGRSGALVLTESLGAVECAKLATIPTFDHTLVIGEVTYVHLLNVDRPPLVTCQGLYYGLGEGVGVVSLTRRA